MQERIVFLYIPVTLATIAILWFHLRYLYIMMMYYGEGQVDAKIKLRRGEMFRSIVAIFSTFMVYGSQYLLHETPFLAQFFGVILFVIGYQLLLWTAGIRLEILGTAGSTNKI